MSKIYEQYMYGYPHKTAYRPVERAMAEKALAALPAACPPMGQNACGLYLHLPFCRVKCGYCNLFSVAGANENAMRRYLDATKRQLTQFADIANLSAVRFTSLTLGGGTPSYLPLPLLQDILAALKNTCGLTPSSVYSIIELSPGESGPEALRFIKETGFCRVSVGIQSFHETELAVLQRKSNTAQIRQALERVAASGFSDFNIDLMYGIPGQTCTSLEESIRCALNYAPGEIFLYPLYLRPFTPLAPLALNTPPEHAVLDMYRSARDFLAAHGYRQISMRRFLRGHSETPYRDCGLEHNLALGCGGRSYLGDLHLCEPFAVHPQDCANTLARFSDATDFLSNLYGYVLNADEKQRRYAAKNLLHSAGLDLSRYKELFGADPLQHFPFLAEWCKLGYAEQSGARLCLTPQGLELSDCLGPRFISERVRQASAAFYGQETKYNYEEIQVKNL